MNAYLSAQLSDCLSICLSYCLCTYLRECYTSTQWCECLWPLETANKRPIKRDKQKGPAYQPETGGWGWVWSLLSAIVMNLFGVSITNASLLSEYNGSDVFKRKFLTSSEFLLIENPHHHSSHFTIRKKMLIVFLLLGTIHDQFTERPGMLIQDEA